MNWYRREYEKQHPPKNHTHTLLKIISVVIAITIVAVVSRLSARADIAPAVIHQGADIIGKTAEVGIAPGVSVYVPGVNCEETSTQITTEQVEINTKQQESATSRTKQHEYSNICISDAEMQELKAIVAAEAQTQSLEGREAVVEVIFNRVLSPEYPDSVHGVLSQKGQFATWKLRNASWVVPDAATAAIEHVMSEGRTVLPDTSYVYFDTKGTNGRKHIKIGAHYFGK